MITGEVWDVTIRKGKDEEVYPNIIAKGRYNAAMLALSNFLRKYNLEGRPYEYWSGNKRAMGLTIQTKNHEDARKAS